MRMCPKCRLVTSDDKVCAECGWNLGGTIPSGSSPAQTYAEHLQSLTIFSAVMFVAAFAFSFSVTHGDLMGPPMAGGLFAAGLIADLFLLRLIYRAAGLYQEARRWTVGAALTFPFGTLVFAWLLARRIRLERTPPG
jgi:rRNA maturation protein Nop10